jgi:hypothetical protein
LIDWLSGDIQLENARHDMAEILPKMALNNQT